MKRILLSPAKLHLLVTNFRLFIEIEVLLKNKKYKQETNPRAINRYEK